MLLVTAAKMIANVISPGDNGAYKMSTIFPCILPIMIEDEVWAKACCIICIAMSPGARNVINGYPNAPPPSFPIANESTIKKSNEVISGEKIV